VPFFPFTAGEAAVVAHKYLLKFSDCLKEAIETSKGDWQQHIYLEVPDDGALCTKLAKDSYFVTGEARKSGARCIEREVVDAMEARLNEKWFEMEELSVDDLNRGAFLQFRTEVHQLGQNEEQIGVVVDGHISAPRQIPK
jgi:hypothetical protein